MQDQFGAQYTITGRANEVAGRKATLKMGAFMENKTVSSVTSVGPAGPTMAEQQKSAAVLATLQGDSKVADSPFLKMMYPDGQDVVWPESFTVLDETPPLAFDKRPLNDSQEQAVQAMLTLNNSSRLTMIHGPPGTGKTTVSP